MLSPLHNARKYRNDDPADDGAGAITPEIQGLIDAAVATQVQGLKTKNGDLIAANKALRDKFDGLDPVLARKLLTSFSDAEEAALVQAGDIKGVVERRTGNMKTAHDAEMATIKARADRLGSAAVKAAIAAAAASTGALPEGINYLILQGQAEGWTVDDEGNVVQRKGAETVYGKDGKTPLTPAEWAEGLKATAPLFWPKAQGSGANGGSGGTAAKPFEKLTEAERVSLYRDNPVEFNRQVEAQKTATH